MAGKNPDFHFQIIMLLFILAVFPVIFLGSQNRLSLTPFARENSFPVWKQVEAPTASFTPYPTQTPLSYAAPTDHSDINKLTQLNYQSPTPSPAPNMKEILNTPNVVISQGFDGLVSFFKLIFNGFASALGQFGH
ncbi:MAG: hypothetical protein M1120_03100 [Patescibacteria group bacterium]|nr:hypothetical protein [Patescibacteria group bacterium]